MKTPTRFVRPLTPKESEELWQLVKGHGVSPRVRLRAHGILMSSKRYTVDQIADLAEVDRDTVASWITSFESQGADGLGEGPRSGRPRKVTESDEEKLKELVKDDPRSATKKFQAEFEETHGETLCQATVRRILERLDYTWKRMRRGLDSKRDQAAYETSQAELADFTRQANKGTIDLYYGDQSGVTLTPSIPYGWQLIGRENTIRLPSERSSALNVFGCLRWTGDHLFSRVFEGSFDSDLMEHCIDKFAETLQKPTVLVLDNARIHHSDDFEDRFDDWERLGLSIYFIPPYCPELNLIELLWKKIKYEWLPLSAYHSFQNLVDALMDTLKLVGTKHQISFV